MTKVGHDNAHEHMSQGRTQGRSIGPHAAAPRGILPLIHLFISII
jgi:hypothetical protein